MPKYTEADAAKDTGASAKQVERAWHDARDDAAREGGHSVPADRHSKGGDEGGGGSKDPGHVMGG